MINYIKSWLVAQVYNLFPKQWNRTSNLAYTNNTLQHTRICRTKQTRLFLNIIMHASIERRAH